MNGRQRRKIFAGAGLVSMLFGALMVVAPGAGAVVVGSDDPRLDNGGNLQCASLDPSYTTSGKQDTSEGQISGTITENGFLVDWELVFNDEGDEDNEILIEVKDGSAAVWAVIIKTGNATNENSNAVTAYEEYDPALEAGDTDLIGFPGNAVSNIRVCGTTPDEPTLTVSKSIDSEDDLEDTFPVTVAKSGETVRSGSLGDGDSLDPVDPADGDYVITETLPEDGWLAPTIDCGDATVVEGEEDGVWTVTVDDEDVVCTITNTPEDEEPDTSLTLRKVVSNSASWSIDLTCTADVPDEVIAAAALAAPNSQRVTNQAPSFECADQAGTYVIEEDLTDESPSNMVFVSLACTVPNGEGGTTPVDATLVQGEDDKWTVEVDEGQAVTCTFTNRVPTSDIPPPPTPDEASLTIEKDWVGTAPADWEVDFIGDLGGFTLTDEDDTEVFDDIEPGTYVIREAPSSDYDLDDVECSGATAVRVGNGVRVTVADEADVTCTFTNVEVEVLPSPPVTPPGPPPSTPPVQPKPEAPKPTTEVKGVQVTRQLPRTGSESTDIAGFGAGLLLLGAGLVMVSRSRRFGIAD